MPKDPASVTTIGTEESPTSSVVPSDAADRIWRTVERLYQTGLHPAIALSVRRFGRPILDRAIGHASGNGPEDRPETPKVRATPETPFNLFSASKAVTAMVVHLLDERRDLHVDDLVAEYLPEYGCLGKEQITIGQVLTHRAGVPNLPPGALDLDRANDRQWVLDHLCAAQPLWRPGRLLGYHAISGGYILGEVVRRVTGKGIEQVLEEEILRPLGFRWLRYGVRPEEVSQVARNYVTGPPEVPPLSWALERALGMDIYAAARLSNDPRFLTAVVPAGNVVATAPELSRFFQLLLQDGELDGVRVFDRRTVRRATSEQSYLEFDFTLGIPLRYGSGFMLGGRWFSVYGPDTEHAFGHVGFTNVIGWADRERQVSAALMTSGKPFLYPQIYYLWDVLRTIGAVFPKVSHGVGRSSPAHLSRSA
ncbi:MAG: serine hydrolase domain-containing protein [Candidatus Binatia bacterium]